MKITSNSSFQGAMNIKALKRAMTEQGSANEKNMFHFSHKIFWQGDRFLDFEEIERLIKSMEKSDGWAERRQASRAF